MSRFFKWLGLYDHDGRKAWAFLSMLLGCGIMTGFAAWALWLVRDDPDYAIILGIAAHLQVLVALTGFTAFFVKRNVEGNLKDGSFKVEDQNDVQHPDK